MVSCTTSPVTQTAEVAVNSVSLNGVTFPPVVEIGSISSSAPIRMTPAKPNINDWHNPYPQLAAEVRAAASDLAALKFEVLEKVGEAVGNVQTYQL